MILSNLIKKYAEFPLKEQKLIYQSLSVEEQEKFDVVRKKILAQHLNSDETKVVDWERSSKVLSPFLQKRLTEIQNSKISENTPEEIIHAISDSFRSMIKSG